VKRFPSASARSRHARRAAAAVVAAGLVAAVVVRGDAVAAPEQEPPPLAPSIQAACDSIRGDRILKHVSALCDPALHGRVAGDAGARAAAEYIARQFAKAGLTAGGSLGTFQQTFKIRAGYLIDGELSIAHGRKSEALKRRKEFMPVHIPSNQTGVEAECVFAGYGICSDRLGFDDYADVDVEGKAVIVFSGVPWSRETAAWLWRIEKRSRESLPYKAHTAADYGAALLLVVDDPGGWRPKIGINEELRLPDSSFPVDSPIPIVQVTQQGASRLMGLSMSQIRQTAQMIRATRQPHSTALPGRRLTYSAAIRGTARIGRNVIGVLPGVDPDLRSEALVIGAHYDHLGEGAEGVYCGANDNAAGVGAMIEIARACRLLAEPPRRSLVFVAFAAEEMGQLGSSYYAAHPCIPTNRTVLMTNFDMIARNAPEQIFAVATRSSAELHRIHQAVNAHVGLELVHPEDMRLGRSDHTAFYHAGVPVMYLFGGLHRGYHTVEDTIDRLIPDKAACVARLAFLTSYCVAQREERILPDWSARP